MVCAPTNRRGGPHATKEECRAQERNGYLYVHHKPASFAINELIFPDCFAHKTSGKNVRQS